MLRTKPILPYCGLTIIMSNPSRFDKTSLLNGTGGMFLKNECIYPCGINFMMCDIRLAQDKSPWLDKTKAFLVLGEPALKSYLKDAPSLNQQRGHLFEIDGIPAIASYSSQEAVDIKNYERDNNLLLKELGISSDKENISATAQDEKSRKGLTSKSNFRFWLQKDVEKVIGIIHECSSYRNRNHNYNTLLYPPSSVVVEKLGSRKGTDLYFDCETDDNFNFTVFAFSFGDDTEVYSVPVVDHDYSLAYDKLATAKIFKALAIAIRDNTLIAHNGAGFDFFVLAHRYNIPIGQSIYDTMLAQNRIYPEVEKSLGHCLSLPWLYLPYHKDEASFAYGNAAQARQHWTYCAKDVIALKLLKQQQDIYARSKVGITDSIDSVNSYVRSYLTATLFGIPFDAIKIETIIGENDRLMMQYIRILEILVGKEWIDKIKKSGKSAMPGSPKQCARYFHELLDYSVISRTETGEASVDKKALFAMKLGIVNPVIDLVITYRRLAKESGSLKFNAWKV